MYINIYASDESQFQVCAALVPRIYVCIFVRVKKLKIAALAAKPVLHVTAQLNKSEWEVEKKEKIISLFWWLLVLCRSAGVDNVENYYVIKYL